MARGQPSKIGDTRVAPNGYHYTRTAEGWRATHEIVAEKNLGRPLNKEIEGLRFVDGDRTNLSPENIVVRMKREKSNASQRARLEARIEQLQAELEELVE